MNIFNRVLAVILFLALIAATVVSIITLAGYTLTLPGSIFSQQLDFLRSLSGWERVAAIAAAVAVIAFIVYLIWLEFTAGRPEKTLLLSSNEQGIIYVNKNTVEKFAEKMGRQESAQVTDVHCHIKQKSKGILIDCSPTLRLGTNMNSVNPRIQNRVKESVQDLLGLPVLNVKVRARYESRGRAIQQELIANGRSGNGDIK
jgi:uncharacterized alkaline shock family protein YloU